MTASRKPYKSEIKVSHAGGFILQAVDVGNSFKCWYSDELTEQINWLKEYLYTVNPDFRKYCLQRLVSREITRNLRKYGRDCKWTCSGIPVVAGTVIRYAHPRRNGSRGLECTKPSLGCYGIGALNRLCNMAGPDRWWNMKGWKLELYIHNWFWSFQKL